MSRDVKAGGAYVVLGIKDNVAKGLRNAEKKLKGFGKSVATVGAGLAGAAAGALAAPIALASDVQETMGKFGVVFGEQTDVMKKWSDSTADAMGVARVEMAGMAASMQDLLVPMGVAPGKATDMSKIMSQLAVDLGSFNNMPTEQVYRDLTSAMIGTGETMAKYGSVVTDAAVKQEMLNMGMDPKTAGKAGAAQAKLNIIMRDTVTAQGDAIRTGDGFANQMKRVWSNVKNLGAELGGPLLEPLSMVLQVVNKLASKLFEWMQANTEVVRGVGLAIAAVGGLGAVLVAAGAILFGVGAALGAIATGIAILTSPIALVSAAIFGLAVYIYKSTTWIGDALDWLYDQFAPIADIATDTAARIQNAFAEGNLEEVFAILMEGAEGIFLSATETIRGYWDGLMNWMVEIGEWAAKGIGKGFELLGKGIKQMLDGYKSYYNWVFNAVTDAVGTASGVRTIGGPVDAFGSGGGIGEFIGQIGTSVEEFGGAMQDSANGMAADSIKARAAAAEERKARLAELTKTIKEGGDAARKAKAERDALEAPAKAAAAAAAAKGAAAGTSAGRGSFSSAAAMFLGGTGRSIQEKQLSTLEVIAANTKDTSEAIEDIEMGFAP